MRLTQAQMYALYKVYLEWQGKTPHAIMPSEFEIVPDDEYRDGDYIGAWVGGEIPRGNYPFPPGSAMYLGIEKDGYTHS